VSQPEYPSKPGEVSAEPRGPDGHDEDSVTIVLNATPYRVPAGTVTADKLRALPFPPIPADYDLWLEVPGGADTFLRDGDEVQVHDGIRVLAVPRSILAGCPYRDTMLTYPLASALYIARGGRGKHRDS
jgi:Multiubiquitin